MVDDVSERIEVLLKVNIVRSLKLQQLRFFVLNADLQLISLQILSIFNHSHVPDLIRNNANADIHNLGEEDTKRGNQP